MNLHKKIKLTAPAHISKLLKLIGSEADKLNYNAYCVGGFVRDILLGVKNYDIDIAVEQDGLKFAEILSGKLNGTLVVHKKFGTATIYISGGAKIDIATARTEAYDEPAALPTVKFSSIKEDLYRRDFTINAMAVSLNRKNFGDLIDFFGGKNDLTAGKIRVLHGLSFVDDPTRIFRAVRFEQRYNFKIEPHTERLIKTAVSLDMIARTQKQRIRDEIILILSEEDPLKALIRMNRLHELRFIEPGMKLTKNTIRLFKAVRKARMRYTLLYKKKRPLHDWIIYFMAMLDGFTAGRVRAICEKFVFRKGDEKRLLSSAAKADTIARLMDKKSAVSPSRIYKSLEPLSYETIIFIMAKTRTLRARKRMHLFFTKYNGTRLKITGADLKKLNLAPGPRYKAIMDKVLYAKLDGKARTKEEEINLAKRLI
ncbi:MAG: CCA tRNA nucleotidyltransferase [Candidatus Omnitrophica bacterium]|nr:CCA tRNA nucleotidyltransferase [Candidatus Omnitrophota bacterium]